MVVSRKNNPQKYYTKLICNMMYYLGFGSCWYEVEPQGRTILHSRLYLIWACLSNLYIIGVYFDEILGNFRTDLTAQERNDVIQFSLAHSTILGKIIFNYIYRKDIKVVLERLLERKFLFVNAELDKACVKRFVTLCIVVVGASYFTLTAATLDGIRVHFSQGIPVRTEVVYYPSSSDSGPFVNILRFLTIFHWFYLVAIMAVIDCLCIVSLVIAGYKFKILQAYFDSLRKKVEEDAKRKTRRELQEEFRRDFVVGIAMHDDALWCAKNVQSTLGNLYSVQIFEGVVILVICLVKLVQVERNLVFLLANFAFILCLVLITGAYMLAGGDITHEASKVSEAIFHSGWELVGARRETRVLAVLALQRSQVPVYMFAFGILTLSYSNFISVIRSSYSFFAVMY